MSHPLVIYESLMKPFLFCVSLFFLACEDPNSADPSALFHLPTSAASIGNLPDKIIGTYVLDNVTLNGPKFEVIVASNPEAKVVYMPNADITNLIRPILFRGGGEIPYVSICSEPQQAIEFKSTGKTSHVCVAGNANALDMGFWNTAGADDALLAWSIVYDQDIIECEITPYEVNVEHLVGYLVFPLPKDLLSPVLEGDNRQYRKIRMVLRKV